MKKLNLHKKDTYGIEIEFVTRQTPVLQQKIDDLIAKKKLHPDWILKPEKSCDEYGVEGTGQEINSPVLNYQKSWLQELKQVLHLLEQYTVISSKSAIHFHIGSQIFEGRTRYLQDFLLLWCYYEDILYRFATGEYKTIRKATTYYARPMKVSINDYQIQLLTKSLSMWEFLSEFLKGFGKIFAINLSPCYFAMKYQGSDELQWHKDTIEARIFSTTYDYSLIYAYLDMLLATIEKAKHLTVQERETYIQTLKNRTQYINPNNLVFFEKLNMEEYFQYQLEKAEEFSKLIYQDEKKQKQFMKIYTDKTKSYDPLFS